MLLEADPSVIAFCERPGYIQFDRHKRLADFLARYVDRNELVVLDDLFSEVDVTKPDRILDVDTCTIRQVAQAELAAARIWIDSFFGRTGDGQSLATIWLICKGDILSPRRGEGHSVRSTSG